MMSGLGVIFFFFWYRNRVGVESAIPKVPLGLNLCGVMKQP